METEAFRPLRRLLTGLVCALLLSAAILTLALSPTRTLAGGWLLRRDAEEPDLRGLPIRGTAGLARLRDPKLLDLRGCPLSAGKLLELRERFPDCELLCDVPLGGKRYDCAALSVELTDFSENDVASLALFPALEELDGRSCAALSSLRALKDAEERYPGLRVLRSLTLGSRRFPADTESLTLPAADFNYRELSETLPLFTCLRSVRLEGSVLTSAQGRQLAETFPDLDLDYECEAIPGAWLSNHAEEVDLSGKTGFTLSELRQGLKAFPRARLVDLTGCGFDNDDLCALRDELGIDVRWTISLYGAELCTTDRELDLSGQYVADVGELEAILDCFPYLEKVVMCDCGVKDEVMDALDQRHEDIRFVWMVHFGAFFLRTDATTFIATTFPYGYSFLTNSELQPLTYCRDLIALDLGHMEYSDTSFLWSLPKLQYLILADTGISDLSPLANMKDLRYLELFQTGVRDLSPLLACKKLRHLNLAFTSPENAEVLGEMDWLERLWIPGVYLNGQAEIAVRDKLTNTRVERWTNSSTGAGWRTDPAYYEMRDVFGVYYMKG